MFFHLLLDKPVVRYAALVHNALYAVDVLLRDALADIDTNAVVLAICNFFQVHADVVNVPFPRTDSVVLPTEAIEVASSLPDGRLGAAILWRRSSQEDGQLRIDVALHASRYLNRLRDEVHL